MKILAYYALHYGKEYLAWSLRSVREFVDEFHVLYTAKPSFGHGTTLRNPDSFEDLRRIFEAEARKPIFWHVGEWNGEGDHRGAMNPIAKERKADLLLWVDSDEVWEPETLYKALLQAKDRPEETLRVRFLHFWKSLWWVCEDACMPTRIIKPSGTGFGYLDNQAFPVLHFGYAQSARLTEYKQDIHGHKGEWRPDWFQKKFLAWTPGSGIGDVHPTCTNDFWMPKPVPVHPANVARHIAKTFVDHPYFNMEVVP